MISVDHPWRQEPIGLVALQSGGVATSSVAKRQWTVDGTRRNHLIDPSTGRSLRRRAIAVTVLSREAVSAEIATKHALMADPGVELSALEELGCDGLIVTEGGDIAWTRGFDRFRIEERQAS